MWANVPPGCVGLLRPRNGRMMSLKVRVLLGPVHTTPRPHPQTHRFIVLFLTFLCYMAYHASRKPPSIVKSVLNGARSGAEGSEGGWYPFDTAQGKALLGDVDLAFLGAQSLHGVVVTCHR